MAPRRTPPTVRAALHQLAIATATGPAPQGARA